MVLEQLKNDLYEAQKAKDASKLLVLRYLLSQVQNFEIELRTENRELTDEDVLLVFKRQIKRRKKAIEQFELGNRPEIVAKEKEELAMVEEYYKGFRYELGIED